MVQLAKYGKYMYITSEYVIYFVYTFAAREN